MNLRMFTIQILILALVHAPFLNRASKLHVGDGQPSLRQRIEQFGVGTEVKVKLADGTKLRGLVERIDKESFLLAGKGDGASREIAYSDLDKLSYPKRGYKTEGTPDPVAAKRMVVQLGVGEHIMVKVGPTQKVRGHIREINNDYFVVQPRWANPDTAGSLQQHFEGQQELKLWCDSCDRCGHCGSSSTHSRPVG